MEKVILETEENLEKIKEPVIGLDLELANSFWGSKYVICMAGLSVYDHANNVIRTTIVHISEIQDEKQLLQWLINELELELSKHNGNLLLITFAGLSNDMRWIAEKCLKLGIDSDYKQLFNKLQQFDLQREFARRTLQSRVSLKKLERMFGIDRQNHVNTHRLSKTLTKMLTHNRDRQQKRRMNNDYIQYLHEDAKYLLKIYNDWSTTSLDEFNLTDLEYYYLLLNLQASCNKYVTLTERKGKRLNDKIIDFKDKLGKAVQRSVSEKSFANFRLPELQAIGINAKPVQTIERKYNNISNLAIINKGNSQYRLRETMFRPWGALAVVVKDDLLLFIKRSDTMERAPGAWGFPGGMAHSDETPAMCAERELHEELKLSGKAKVALGTTESYTGDVMLYWMHVEVDDFSTLEPAESEVASYCFMPIDAISELSPLIPLAAEQIQKIIGISNIVI